MDFIKFGRRLVLKSIVHNLRKLFRFENKSPGIEPKEIKSFYQFLSTLIRSEETGLQLHETTKLNYLERFKRLPGIYLNIESSYVKSFNAKTKQPEILRMQLRAKFPAVANNEFFRILFLDDVAQQESLGILLIDLVWEETKNVVGYSKEEIINNYKKVLTQLFRQFKDAEIDQLELQTTIKYEVYNVYSSLSELLGRKKVNVLFHGAYEFLNKNYQLLDSFSFVLGILPEFLLKEQQIRLLSRQQVEEILMDRTRKLEDINAQLMEEIIQKERAQKELEESADRLNQIVESALDAVILLDAKGNVEFWNTQAEAVFGWSQEEMLGVRLSDRIIPENMQEGDSNYLNDLLTNEEATYLGKRIEQTGVTKQGTEISLELSMVANTVSDKKIYTAFIRDISERKRHEQELLNAKNKAEQATKAKADFLSTMSHEIRTPMNGLFGMIELLLAENPRTDQLDSLNLMKHSSENLLVILNDILDFSKIESGHIEFEKRNFELKELAERVVATYKQRAEEKGIGLKLECNMEGNGESVGDPVRLSQILNNLISNAIKFTYHGEVKLIVTEVEQHNKKSTFRFEVIDSGVGISEEDLQRVFERFTQVEHQREQDMQAGTGLGLAISRKLLNLQESELLAESEVGKGSKFFFDLKLKHGKRVKQTPSTPTQVNKDLTGINILLVEDNKVNQIVANKFLSKWNCSVTIVNNGQEAIDEVKSEKFDLILMDIQMPVKTGYEASAEIRKMQGEFYQKVPIIALTADALPGVKEKVFEAGMNELMTKPLDPDILYYTLRSNLSAVKE